MGLKSKLRQMRWRKITEFFESVKEKIESSNYEIIYDNERWNITSLTIDEDEHEVYMSEYISGSNKNTVTHLILFRDDEYDCKFPASKIIDNVKKRLLLFTKTSVSL